MQQAVLDCEKTAEILYCVTTNTGQWMEAYLPGRDLFIFGKVGGFALLALAYEMFN